MPGSSVSAIRGWSTRHAVMLVLVVSALLALAFDLWYRGELIARERQRVSAYAAPYASAVETAVSRRLARLAGLRTFVRTRSSLDDLTAEFPTFASGLRFGTTGIRALELVRNGRITAVVPSDSNAGILGVNLYGDRRPEIPRDVIRAIESGGVTITGPVRLLQGGEGLIARQGVQSADSTFPDLVALVIDLPAIFTEASRYSLATSTSLVVLDRKLERLHGPDTTLDNPVSVPIRIPDGGWTLLAAPANGWHAAVARDLRPTRIASVLIAALLAWLTSLVAGSQTRLLAAVEQQTRGLRSANEALQQQVREREAAEQRLHEQDERLRLALTGGQMGTWEFQPADDRLQLSAGALHIIDATEGPPPTTGRALRDRLPVESRHVVETALSHALDTGDFRAEFRITGARAGDRWLYATGERQHDAKGSVRLAGVLMDVTDRRQLEEQLLHSQKMEAVGTLAGGIAHDFNNLLTAILGFARLSQQQAEALTGDAASAPTHAQLVDLQTDLEEIVKAGERAALLTSQLLAFSRRQVTKAVRLDLNAAVHEVERMLQRLIGERITLRTQLAMHPLYVRADAGQLAQVMVNLVVNARDAMPGGGEIRVRTEDIMLTEAGEAPLAGLAAGHWCILSVSDDGAGMTPDVMSRMFEPFFTTKQVGEGTGLGLSTVYGIVTQVGGQVLVESAPGSGTTVRVALPWEVRSEAIARTPRSNVAVRSTNKRILVVEDEPGLRRLVAEILSRRGFDVDVANDGVDALALLDASPVAPDLILTDVVMPRLDGLALAHALKQRGLSTPVLFMSGYPAGGDIPLEMAEALIDKPFTPEVLVARVRAALEPTASR